MKVSRKVGWRKCASSYSISRRRLRNKKSRSGYRKKNAKTQKGGKRCRGYNRMRSHTHKRGRRFHRGGIGGIGEPYGPASVLELEHSDSKDYAIDTTYTRPPKYFQLRITDKLHSLDERPEFTCQVKYYMQDNILMVKVLVIGDYNFEFNGTADSIYTKLTRQEFATYTIATSGGKRYYVYDTENEFRFIGNRIKFMSMYAEKFLKRNLEVKNAISAPIPPAPAPAPAPAPIPLEHEPEPIPLEHEPEPISSQHTENDSENGHTQDSSDELPTQTESKVKIPTPTPTPEAVLPNSSLRTLPENISSIVNREKIDSSFEFDYKRTDGIYGLRTEFGTFDVVLVYSRSTISDVYLLRHDKNNTDKYDKQIIISIQQFNAAARANFTTPLTGIQGYKIDTYTPDGTYTFPVTTKNSRSFLEIQKTMRKD